MKATLLADTHLLNSLPMAKRIGVDSPLTDRLSELAEEVLRLVETAGNEIVIRIGDWYDRSRPDAVTQLVSVATTKTMLDRGHLVVDIPGNHEAYTLDASEGFAYANDHLAKISPRMIVHHGGPLPLPGAAGIYAFPFQAEAALLRRLEEVPDGAGLFLHQTILGAKDRGWSSPTGIAPEALARFGFVLMGHFHTEQFWREDQGYIGATIQLDPSDAGDTTRGAYSVELHGGRIVSRKKIPSTMPSFFRIIAQNEADCDEQLQGIPEGHYVQVRLEGSAAELSASREWRRRLKKVYERRFRHFDWHEVVLVAKRDRLQLPVGRRASQTDITNAFIEASDTKGLEKELLQQIAAATLQRGDGDKLVSQST